MVDANPIQTLPAETPAEPVRPASSTATLIAILVGALLIAAAILAQPWLGRSAGVVTFDKPYQAVLLSNGQVYYGRLEGYGTSHPVMREVYYIQVQANPQTHEQKNILLKRGKEWHSPDRMYLSPNQIILVEPVGTESKVMDLIKEIRSQ